MAIYYEEGSKMVNYLESAEGVIIRTRLITYSNGGILDGDKMIVKAGTFYPSSGSNCIGLVYEDVDVTHGEVIAPVLIGGRVYTDRLPSYPEADTKAALSDAGIILIDDYPGFGN